MKQLLIDSKSYYMPFRHLGMSPTDDYHRFLANPSDFGLVVLTGGADVSPSLYGQENFASGIAPRRDEREAMIVAHAIDNNIPLAGICRGAQFLCVAAGGELIQDCDNHAGPNHELLTKDGERFTVTSTHHQMQHPWNLNKGSFEILAFSETPLSTYYNFNGERLGAGPDNNLAVEPDVVYYSSINALAAQFHPEWMEEDGKAVTFFRKMLAEKLGLHEGKKEKTNNIKGN